jgi:hypothetical protein
VTEVGLLKEDETSLKHKFSTEKEFFRQWSNPKQGNVKETFQKV